MGKLIQIEVDEEDAVMLVKIAEAWNTTPEKAFRRMLEDYYRRLHRNSI